ncbi:hypothetical protein R1sor_026329 [Riccia sorocarpa]|uniref:Uncharacterized protein n=1 Tax=Riccia sorocarpa TaxID=122646 RepID=A0ABD3GCP8_9MARC
MAWKMILAVLGLVLTHAAAVPCPPSDSQKVTVPMSYLDPCDLTDTTCEWRGFANGANTVILNVSLWGAGTEVDPSYVKLIKQIRERTRSGTGTITTILVSPMWCVSSNLMSSLVKYVRGHSKSPSGQHVTIASWLLDGPECYLKTNPSVDSFVFFAGSYADFESYVPAAYMRKYSATRWYHIVGDVAQSQLASALRISKAKGAGRIFITDERVDFAIGHFVLPDGVLEAVDQSRKPRNNSKTA